MNARENTLRAIEYRYPEWIPCRVALFTLIKQHGREVEKIMLRHPRLFPGCEEGMVDHHHLGPRWKPGEITDSWGCVWRNAEEGVIGQVVGHPLEDWENLDSYRPPDPLTTAPFGTRNWEATARQCRRIRESGGFVKGDGETLFDRLYALRGFENLMIDIVTDDSHLLALIEMLTDYEVKLVDKWLEIGVDQISFHTDIGTQRALMISPEKFRQYIKPMYKKIFMRCREAGTHVRLSSDGVLLAIVDDLLECGVTMHDPQFRANGLDGIVKQYKGRMCIELDLDRQMFPFCKPADVRKHVKEAVEALYMPEGGLTLAAINTPDVPLEIVRAQCEAFEEFCFPGK